MVWGAVEVVSIGGEKEMGSSGTVRVTVEVVLRGKSVDYGSSRAGDGDTRHAGAARQPRADGHECGHAAARRHHAQAAHQGTVALGSERFMASLVVYCVFFLHFLRKSGCENTMV